MSATTAAANAADEVAPAASAVEGLTPGRLAWRRLRRNKMAMISLSVALFVILVSAFAPIICGILGVSPNGNSDLIADAGMPVSGPSAAHPFGIEPGTGRDILALLLYGARVSLLIALTSVILTVALGVLLGTIAAATRGFVDRALSWLMDLTLTFPSLLLLLALSNVMIQRLTSIGVPQGNPSRIVYIILFFAIFGWPYLARIVRGQVISLREREFVEAATAMGASRWRIIRTELIPNLWAPVIVYSSISLPGVIAAEATLSFLGVGTDASLPTWGKLLSDSVGYAQVYPAYLWFPSVGLVITVLAFNLFGDAVRDALDPRAGRV